MGKQTILLTGAAGFIGSHTAERLLARGDRVVGVDNFNDYYSPAQKRDNARALAGHPGFSLIEGDIRDPALIQGLFAENRFSAIVHLAAMAGVRASVEAPALYYDVNLNATLLLLEAAIQNGKPNFVFASTSSAYGRTELIPFDESDPADRPLAPYPASKRSAELLGHAYHHMHGLDFTAVRFFTVYGPGNRPDMLAFLAMDAATHQGPLTLYNQGEMYRDWTYVGDIADGVVSAVDRRLGYEVVNLGRGEPIELAAFVSKVSDLCGSRPVISYKPMPAADVTRTYAKIDKARRLLGYDPKVSVDEGIAKLHEWYVSRPKS